MTTTAKAPPPRQRRFTVEEYNRMGEAGVFGEDDRVELLDGQIYAMSPIGSEHAACVRRLNRLFQTRAGDRALVSIQNPVRLDDTSEPEPDLALLEPRADAYASAHPGPESVLLIVEVADTSLAFDRDVKLPLYAEAGIPEVWLVDLDERTIHVYRTPSGNRYASHEVQDSDAELALPSLPDLTPIDSSDLLPPSQPND